MKKFQITCRCSAYKFPHRLSSGKCNAVQWCESYYWSQHTECHTCNNNIYGECQVATGRESFDICPAIENCMHNEIELRLPITYEQWVQEQEQQYIQYQQVE